MKIVRRVETVHQCNAWCEPPIHADISYVDRRVAGLDALFRHYLERMAEQDCLLLAVEEATEAPPPTMERLQSFGVQRPEEVLLHVQVYRVVWLDPNDLPEGDEPCSSS